MVNNYLTVSMEARSMTKGLRLHRRQSTLLVEGARRVAEKF